MDIFISVNNRAEVIQLPIIPSEFKISSPVNNETFTTISQGDIKMFGERGLNSLVIETFFPKEANRYRFARAKRYSAWQHVNMINRWIDRKLRVRLIITNTPINMVCIIDNFEYGPQDGSGDIYYSLTLSEFPYIKITSKAASKPASAKPKPAPKPAAPKTPTKKGNMKTNSIVDYLKSIGVNSSMANRKKLAAQYGIKNYTGTAAQNIFLLKKLRG